MLHTINNLSLKAMYNQDKNYATLNNIRMMHMMYYILYLKDIA